MTIEEAERERDHALEKCNSALYKIYNAISRAEKAERDRDAAEVERDDAVRTAQDNAAECEKLKAELASAQNDAKRYAEIARLRKIEAAAQLACGVLWMIENRRGKVATAFHALRDALGQHGLGEAIQRAIDEGHEADHPPSADWWAGKKE